MQQTKRDVDSDIIELRKANTDIIKELGVLVAASSKLEVSMAQMSDAIEILARSQIKLEFHDEQISTILATQKEHDASIRNLETSIYQACDAKKTEMTVIETGLDSKINENREQVEKNSTAKSLAVLSAVAFIFGYIYLDMSATKAEQLGRDTVIFEKLDNLLTIATSTEKNVAINSVEISHIKKELDEEAKHEHGGSL